MGRAEELRRLRLGLEAARRGRFGSFWVLGEVGIGKTRTLDELACYARLRGFSWHRVLPAAFTVDAAAVAARVRDDRHDLVLVDDLPVAWSSAALEASRALAGLPTLLVFGCRTARALAGPHVDVDPQLRLRGLAEPDVTRLLAAHGGRWPSRAFAARVARETDGNPRRIVEWAARWRSLSATPAR